MPRLSKKARQNGKEGAACRRCALCGLLFAVLGLLGVLSSSEAALGLYVTMRNATAAATQGLYTGSAAAKATETSETRTTTSTTAGVDVTRALDCLRLTTPGLNLSYPRDAEAHFKEINKALARWRVFSAEYFTKRMKNPYHCGEGFCGPWMENLWMTRCNRLLQGLKRGQRLSEIFGPYIPIILPFVDTWSANVFEYEAMIDTLKRVMRPHVPYVAVVQHDTGLVAARDKCKDVMHELPNLLVFSAGGYGHVAVPLFKQPEPLNRFAKPMAERGLLVNYMGSHKNAPYKMRERMIQTVGQAASDMGAKKRVFIGYGGADFWHRVMGNSRASLCPRGYGRTSFHVTEALQMGHVPIHVYLDIPWVPYPELFPSLGFATTVEGLPRLMERLEGMSNSSLEAMETRVREVRESHFTLDAMLDQIFLFLTGKDGGGDLRCQRLPKTMNS